MEQSVCRNTSEVGVGQYSTEQKYAVKNVPVNYKCGDCGYCTDRSNTLDTHRNESCPVRKALGLLTPKDKECKYCSKKFRQNALRSHVRHFIDMLKKNKQPKGKHARISLEEFKQYLTEIKLKKQLFSRFRYDFFHMYK